MVTKQQLNFTSRLRALTTRFLDDRKDLKSLKEEFNELQLQNEFVSDAHEWSGDNPELGAHASITVPQIFACLGALDAGENALVQGGHVAALLRMKEQQ